ncbi:MAG: hypothetical protein M1476_00215 [Candidatus Thermoplasmatota archaeon]|nr:hypothetical protein [Candidatus Thermoplasmatota archaeon]
MLTVYPQYTGERENITVNIDPLVTLPNPEVQVEEYIVMALSDFPNHLKLKALLNGPQIRELSELLLYSVLKHSDYGLPFVEVVAYEDTGEPAYINLVFEDCNWEEWKLLEEELISAQNLLKGMVAVTCIRGLTE